MGIIRKIKFDGVSHNIEDIRLNDATKAGQVLVSSENGGMTWKDPSLVKQLDNSIFPLVSNLSGEAIFEFDGTNHSTTLTWEFLVNGVRVNPKTIKLTNPSGTTLTTDPSLSSYSVSASSKGKNEFTLTGTYDDTLQTKTSIPSKQSIINCLPKFIGHSSKTALNQSDILSFSKQNLSIGIHGIYTTNTNSDYVWVCTPEELGDITAIFSSGMPFSYIKVGVVSVTIGGTGFNYNCFKSTNTLTGYWELLI